MVINNFNIFGTSFCPSKADAPFSVNTYAVLPGSIALERFQSITGRYSQILEICRNFQLSQFPASNCDDARKSLDAVSFSEGRGI